MSLQLQFETRLEGERIGHKEDLCVCTMLDPRFKFFDFKRVDPKLRDQARTWLINNYVENWAPVLVEEPDEEDGTKPDEDVDDDPPLKRTKVLNFLGSDSEEEEDVDQDVHGDDDGERGKCSK